MENKFKKSKEFLSSVPEWEKDYKKSEDLNMKMMAFYADKESLKKLEEIKVSGLISDSLLARELDVLYRSFIMAKADTAKLNKMIRMLRIIIPLFRQKRGLDEKRRQCSLIH